MSPNGLPAKSLRFIGIVLMGLTSVFTLLGGVGTTCVALNPLGFGPRMARLSPFQWLYILFVIVGVAFGVLGIRATIMLVKGAHRAYRDTLLVLLAGLVTGLIHIVASRLLRGSSMPVDAVVIATALTLAVFLLFRIPAVWRAVDYTKSSPGANRPAAGAAAILSGVLALTIRFTMASSHTWDGVNYAGAFNLSMMAIAFACLLVGAGLLIPWHFPLGGTQSQES